MRSAAVFAVLALAVVPPGAAQDHVRERLSLGADSLFGPGVVGLSIHGDAAKVRLTRPGHVVAFVLRRPAVVQLVLPRRRETQVARAGDLWIDLPWSVTSAADAGATTSTTFSLGRVEVGGRGVPLVVSPPPPVPPRPPDAGPAGGSAVLVIVSDSAWSREAIVRLLPEQLAGSPLAMAYALALALTGGRADTWAAYLVRW